MQKSKIVLAIALGMIFLPTVALHAETGSSANVGLKFSSTDDTRPLPPPPSTGPRLGSSVEERGEVELGDDKGGLRGGEDKDDSTGEKRVIDIRGTIKNDDSVKMRESVDTRKKEIEQKLLNLKGEVRVKLEVDAQARVKKLLGNIFNMLNNQIDRLVKADVKIGQKIDALKTSGVDVTLMTADYVSAQALLAKAKVDVSATSSLSIDQTSTETSKSAIRSLVKTAQDSIKAAGDAYKKVIKQMPESSASVKVEAESNSKSSTQ